MGTARIGDAHAAVGIEKITWQPVASQVESNPALRGHEVAGMHSAAGGDDLLGVKCDLTVSCVEQAKLPHHELGQAAVAEIVQLHAVFRNRLIGG